MVQRPYEIVRSLQRGKERVSSTEPGDRCSPNIMSESSLSDGPPSDATLEQALRHAVQNVYKSGDLEQLTVKRLRKAAEEDLDLQEGFFKQGAAWKEKSKAIIESEVESQVAVVASDDELSCSKSPNPKNSKRTPSKTTKVPKITKGQPSKTSTKRMSAEADNPKKRRRKSRQGDSDDGGRLVELSASGGGGIRKKPAMTRPKKGREQPETAVDSDASDGEADKRKAGAGDAGGAESESDMSVLLDEEPKAKTKRRKSSPSQLWNLVSVFGGVCFSCE